MDCNKQEALRAKEIAERKLLEKDFDGAKKIALKAQQLFPELDNISQLLSVCEVHCAAAVKINGLEDWYGILQVEQTADELSIKKQYRKLALSLHPDKNKLAGAEAAFKLIGEAHRTLTDKEKRSNYDVRRKAVTKSVTQKPRAQQASQKFHAPVQPGVPNIFPKYTSQFNGVQPISIKCPHCNVLHHLPRSFLNRALCCQQCSKTFVAYDVYMRPAPGTVPVYVPKFPGPGVSQQSWIPPQTAFKAANSSSTGFYAQDASKATQDKYFGTNSSSTAAFSQDAFKATQRSQHAADSSAAGLNGDIGGGAAGCKEKGGKSVKNSKSDQQVNNVSTNQTEIKFGDVKIENMKKREPAAKSKNQKGSRKPKLGKCSEDEFSDTESSDSDVIIHEAKTFMSNTDVVSNVNQRRSTRQKRNVTYAEDQSDDDDDDFVSPPKKSRMNAPVHNSSKNDGFSDANGISSSRKIKEELNTNINKSEPPKESSSGQQDNIKEEPEISSSSMDGASSAEPEPCILSYPDPEFHDFDHDRDASVFKCGQVWATYDDLDGMPRFYAKIIDVICSFKVRFTWLETVPETQAKMDWSDAGLPVACGNFRLGATETTDNQAMFSHVISWQKGKKKNSYIVKPGKGEVWAMYKNWDISWSSNADAHDSFEYEIVEIVSDDDSAIDIVMLYKAENFVSVFTRDLDATISSIPCSEMLRFSHMVPSYKIPVPEAESFCRVYYEIDPGALPSDFGDKFLSVKLGNQVEHALRQIKGMRREPEAGHVENPVSHCMPDKTTVESEWLHNFELEKSYARLAVGQIWALHCDIDAFPKFYAYISNIEYADSKVSVRWLDYCDDLDEDSPWLSNAVPIACGRFKLSTSEGSRETFCSLEKFSHLVQFESHKRFRYSIYPNMGEVWALYRNWSMQWEESDIRRSEHDVVEVLYAGPVTTVAVLMKVNGCRNAIFMHKTENASVVTLDIPRAEILRFSHRVPSHRLTGGPWKGYWQLDPLCVPVSLLK